MLIIQFYKYNDNISEKSATNAESNDLTTLTKEHPTGKHLGGKVLGRRIKKPETIKPGEDLYNLRNLSTWRITSCPTADSCDDRTEYSKEIANLILGFILSCF